jgi:dihydropteroate synthase
MGVLNVTPDSFSDGGNYLSPDAAIAHAEAMRRDGAHIVDVGGESTRPGAERVSEQVELERVMPVVSELSRRGFFISVDTMRASVAEAAISAGAQMVNDVSGGRADAAMFDLIARWGGPYVLTHWRAQSRSMDSFANYQDVTQDVIAETKAQIARAEAAGVVTSQLVLDPGFGFAKDVSQNWHLLRDLTALLAIGPPLLIGVSRKRFIASLLDPTQQADNALKDLAGAAIAALAVAGGVWGVRTHDPAGVSRAIKALGG